MEAQQHFNTRKKEAAVLDGPTPKYSTQDRRWWTKTTNSEDEMQFHDSLKTWPLLLLQIRNRLGLRPEDVENALREYRRFFFLKCHLKDFNDLMLSPAPDKINRSVIERIWMEHMLRPRDYYSDCMKCAGNVIKHTPTHQGDHEKRPSRYSNTVENYKAIFQQEPPVKWWPKIKKKVPKRLPFVLSVKTPNGSLFNFKVKSNYTIKNVKALLTAQEKKSITPTPRVVPEEALWFGEVMLHPEKKLAFYGIYKPAVLYSAKKPANWSKFGSPSSSDSTRNAVLGKPGHKHAYSYSPITDYTDTSPRGICACVKDISGHVYRIAGLRICSPVSRLKENIEAQAGIPMQNQRLFINNGEIMHNKRNLGDYPIGHLKNIVLVQVEPKYQNGDHVAQNGGYGKSNHHSPYQDPNPHATRAMWDKQWRYLHNGFNPGHPRRADPYAVKPTKSMQYLSFPRAELPGYVTVSFPKHGKCQYYYATKDTTSLHIRSQIPYVQDHILPKFTFDGIELRDDIKLHEVGVRQGSDITCFYEPITDIRYAQHLNRKDVQRYGAFM